MAKIRQAGLIFVIAMLAGRMTARETIDRIVATVNGTAILQSEVDEAIRVELLLEGRPLNTVTPAQEQEVLQRVIDQQLLRQQMSRDFARPSAEEISERVQQVRAQLPEAAAEDGWRTLLSRYGLQESDVTERIAVQMQVSKFVEARLQPWIQIRRPAVEAYYKDKFLPELRRRNVQPEPPLDQVRAQIEEILRQEQVNDLLTNWLRAVRQQSRVQVNSPAAALPGNSAAEGNQPAPEGSK